MTWTKLSESFADDPKLLAISRGARLLHVEGLVWSNRVGSDGHIPTAALVRITDQPDPVAAANELVGAGKWRETPTGWEIVGFLVDQPSAADVATSQQLNRERQQRWRWHQLGKHDLCPPGRRCNASTNASPNVSTNAAPSDRPSDRKGGRTDKKEGGGTPLGVDATAPAADALTQRRNLAAAIRDADNPQLRRRFLATFLKEYGSLYGRSPA
jgi:hypothetical protein